MKARKALATVPVLALFLAVLVLAGGCSGKGKAEDTAYAGPGGGAEINGVSFSIGEMETRSEIKPEEPSGYYHYYEEQKGWKYYVITGQAANKGPYTLNAENLAVNGTHGKKSYEGRLLFSNPEKSEFIKEIKADEELEFYFILLVKDKDLLPDKLEICYTNDFKAPKEDRPYDKLLIWTLPQLPIPCRVQE
ncbi:Uncharacterised protein [[Eubacterium] contortum]|uniref:Uncharacterized protein n=1 Tax=Faecalicatena contorta TaxID=39482 RepID=A0A174FUZ6_9FIRM|nr:hypothetical protein [Faecalicatena contorta]CUO54084.1 Uncharacterised protein [[Eubacterium] contortum] [Faecalicatena contorta]